MKMPQVVFKKLTIEENLDNLVWYAKPENSKNSPLNFYQFTLNLFPELNGKLKENMSDEEVYMILDKYVKPILKDLYDNSNDLKKYQTIWNKVNNEIMKDLGNKLNINWRDQKIICRVGLLPVCPRDILGKTFDINYGCTKDNIIATAIHELCHFIYFEKWREIYPDCNENEFDFPHIAWYLSEAMIDPLINNDTFKKYTNDDLYSYSAFYEIFIDGKSIIDILRSYVQNYSIEDAIKMGYELFKNNQSMIKNIKN